MRKGKLKMSGQTPNSCLLHYTPEHQQGDRQMECLAKREESLLFIKGNTLKLTRYCYVYTGLLTLTFSLFEQETSAVPKCYLSPPDRVSYKCSAPMPHITTFGYLKPECPSMSVVHLP